MLAVFQEKKKIKSVDILLGWGFSKVILNLQIFEIFPPLPAALSGLELLQEGCAAPVGAACGQRGLIPAQGVRQPAHSLIPALAGQGAGLWQERTEEEGARQRAVNPC